MWGRNGKLEKIFKGHLPNGDSISTAHIHRSAAILRKTYFTISVLATICVNSSKESFPSLNKNVVRILSLPTNVRLTRPCQPP